MPLKMLVSVRDDVPKSRSWRFFQTKEALSREVIDYYEDFIQATQNEKRVDDDHIKYSSEDVFEFLEKHFDEIVCLVQDPDSENLWLPYGLSYINGIIYEYLRAIMERCKVGDEYIFVDIDADTQRTASGGVITIDDDNKEVIDIDDEPAKTAVNTIDEDKNDVDIVNGENGTGAKTASDENDSDIVIDSSDNSPDKVKVATDEENKPNGTSQDKEETDMDDDENELIYE